MAEDSPYWDIEPALGSFMEVEIIYSTLNIMENTNYLIWLVV